MNARTFHKVAEIIADPCASRWLKDTLKSALERDMVDAIHDAEVLLGVLVERFKEETGT